MSCRSGYPSSGGATPCMGAFSCCTPLPSRHTHHWRRTFPVRATTSGIGTAAATRFRNECLSATPARRTCRSQRRRRTPGRPGTDPDEHRTISEPAIIKQITMQSYFHPYLEKKKEATDSAPLPAVKQQVEKFREALPAAPHTFHHDTG